MIFFGLDDFLMILGYFSELFFMLKVLIFA